MPQVLGTSVPSRLSFKPRAAAPGEKRLLFESQAHRVLGRGPAAAPASRLQPVPNPQAGTAFDRQIDSKDRDRNKAGQWDPNATVWLVTGDPNDLDSAKITPVRVQDIDPKNATIWLNGMANDAQSAAELGLNHTGKGSFYMIHNPSNGGLSDFGESAVQKLGIPTKVAKSTRDLLRHFDLPTANVVAHSQGSLIANDALEDLRKEGKDMRGMKVKYHGAAANVLKSKMLADSIGAEMEEFRGHALDPVHNIVGMNTMNPLRIAGSLVAAPLLFNSDREKSPHTLKPGDAKKLSPVFNRPVFHPLVPTK